MDILIDTSATTTAKQSHDFQATAERRAARWTLVGCSVLVFLTSVCIMVLELTASRLIARSVGSSLYTWTSVIGVILAGISIGNFIGGWLADRYDHRKMLSWMFFLSSVCCMTIYPLSQWVGAKRPVGMTWPMWVVTLVTVLFLHPSIVLGTISPITASLALTKAKTTGTTVGNVYAWGSMGSIFGTFLAGFFLISSLGTQNIIWLTAATLALLGVFVATGRMLFRGIMVFGWLQFVLWIGLLASARQPQLNAGEKTEWWHKVLGSAHEMGMELGLRNDFPGEYHVESDYFSINVGMRKPGYNETAVPALILDHLVHSFFDPNNPTRLYDPYEKIYAAITERAAESWQRRIEVPLKALPCDASKLPAEVHYDPLAQTLSTLGAINESQFDALLGLSPQGDYWKAILTLTSADNMSLYSGLSTHALEKLPDGVVIPENLERKIHFDPHLGAITRYEILTAKERDALLQLGPDKAFLTALSSLRLRSRQVSSLFIGGGGFVFPRWIEAHFPHRPLIHVLELDPAVKTAVQKHLGLPPDDQTSIKTIVGDARNSVDDLINGKERPAQSPGPHVQYDFIYGDAFNDFSVPWHLTTKEFAEKIHQLLTPDEGVYLVNVIDIYPRAQVPARRTDDQIRANMPQPGMKFIAEQLIPDDIPANTWSYAKPPFESFEILEMYDEDSDERQEKRYVLGCRQPITEELQQTLLDLAPNNSDWANSVAQLTARSKTFNAGRFLGSYLNTVCQVFPNVYVFSAEPGVPSDDRDTFVIACSLKKLDFKDLRKSGGHWSAMPFAHMESTSEAEQVKSPQMSLLLDLSRGTTLTDDYAPVDNFLIPVFTRPEH